MTARLVPPGRFIATIHGVGTGFVVANPVPVTVNLPSPPGTSQLVGGGTGDGTPAPDPVPTTGQIWPRGR